mgnify:CR=1 FL=1
MHINIPGIKKTQFLQFNLCDLPNQLGEEDVKSILSSYSCPLNTDVEYFIKSVCVSIGRMFEK